MRKSRALALVALVVVGALVPMWSPVLVSAAEETGTFAGAVSIEMDAATDGSTSRYELADASKAGNFSIELTGRESTEQESVSGTALSDGEMLPVTAAGTNAPTGPANGQPEVTFTGVEETRQTFWDGVASDGSTDSISVGGNMQPENQTVTVTGQESTSSNSWAATSQSNGESTSISVGGNVPPENQTVTFTGQESATWNNQSGTLSAGGSDSINTGNLEPTGPSNGDPKITVTPEPTTVSNYDQAGSYTDMLTKFAGSEMRVPNSPSHITDVTLHMAQTSNESNLTADIYLHQQGMDGSTGDGTLVKENWQPPTGSDHTLNVDLDNTFVRNTSSSTVFLEFKLTGGTDNDNYHNYAIEARENRNWGGYWYNGDYLDMGPKIEFGGTNTSRVSISDGVGGSVRFGNITSTAAKPIDMGSTNTLSMSGTGTVDYQLEKKDRTGTEDPAIDVDGDGGADASYSGVLTDGETATVSVSELSSGSVSVETMLSGAPTDWTIEADEVTATEDPAIDVDADGSIDVSKSGVLRGGETATLQMSSLDPGTNELAFASPGAGFDWKIDVKERIVTENPQLDIDGDSTPEASYSGLLEPGETVTRGVDLSLGSHEMVVSTQSWSTVSVATDYTEISESVNPNVVINGYEASYDGTLSAGETTTLNVSTDWLANETNVVEVGVGESLSTNAPAARVGVDYYHTAATSHSTSYNSTAWTEERTINKTFIDEQANATLELPFHDSVVNIKELEIARNGSEYTRMDSADYEYDAESAVVTVDLGDVEANESVSVHARGWRVKVNNGDITIREPTLPGDRLDTAIEVTGKDENFWLGIQNQRIVHTYNESWGQPEEYSQVTADGAQQVYLPNAGEGATTRVEYTPLEVTPERGDAVVHIEDLDAQQFHLDQGRTNGDAVTIRWLNAVEDKSYALWSVTHSDTRTVEKAGADGVVFTDDDSAETLQIIASENAGDSGIGGPFGLGQSLQGGLVLALVAGSVAVVYWLQRRYGSRGYGRRDVLVLLTTAGAVTLLGMEIVAPGSASGLISSGTVPILGGAVIAILGLYYGIDYLPGGRRLKIGYLGVGVAFVGVLALEVLAPGSISGTLGPTIAEALDPAIRLGGLAGVGLATYALYRWLFGNSSSGSDSSSSSSGGSSSEDGSAMTQVIVQDNDDSVSTSSGGDD
ncbi:hypothetical protein [Halorussus marinus]|uniref:hypothetical protein n=1 Tax=Halorussus marinus TaxID=2505976 RepID=UPI0010924721|nr:hypothetical protein [Halorussus marinus]